MVIFAKYDDFIMKHTDSIYQYAVYGKCKVYKKKIDKSIDFLRGWEEKIVSIFRLRRCEKVGLSLGPNGARSEIYT